MSILARGSSSSSTSSLIPYSSSRVLMLTLLALALSAVMVNGYLGPRYGKRLPSSTGGEGGGVVSRIVGRGGPRGIQSRSQTKFYAGSRYGGKRSYWSNDMEGPGGDFGPSSSSASSPSNIDCIYIPYVGVRCAVLRSPGGGGGGDLDDQDNQEGPQSFPSSSSSDIRTSVIDTEPSSSSSGQK